MAINRGKPAARGHNALVGKTTVRCIKRFGWKPDLPDHRDVTYAAPRKLATKDLLPNVDLRPKWPNPSYDQGELGSCTANAIAGAIEFAMYQEGVDTFTPSRLFIYYNERVIEGTVNSDAGAQIRDGMKSVAGTGYCGEDCDNPPPECPSNSCWPYDISKFAEQPPQASYDCAANHKVGSYMSISQNLADMKGCLNEGFPFVFGFTVFPSLLSLASPWNLPMPQQGDAPIGGHAVLAMGYDDEEQLFIIRNSWGPNWGDNGYYYMPYAYLLDDNLSDDFWTVRLAD